MAKVYHYREYRDRGETAGRLSSVSPDRTYYSGKLYPSGEFRIGRIPRKKISVSDSKYECTRGKYEFFEQRCWHYEDGIQINVGVREVEAEDVGLSSIPNHHKPAARKNGLQGITSRGRMMLTEGGYLLERRYGKSLGFYTLTCPYTGEDDYRSYNRNIAEITRRYMQEIRRIYERVGAKFSYILCYEVQPQRFEDRGEAVLHLHYMSPCFIPGTREFICTADELRHIYGRICAQVVGVPCDTSASVDCSLVRKSAVGYVAKYVSKAKGDVSKYFGGAIDEVPGQWWSVSASVRRALAITTVSLPTEICGYLFANSANLGESPFGVKYCKPVFMEWEGLLYLVGVAGKFDKPTSLMFQNWAEWKIYQIL